MKIPKGLTETEVLNIFDIVVKQLAPTFKFSYYEVEDLMQEGRLYCIEGLKRFDPTKSKADYLKQALTAFLQRHVRNRFLNLHRDKLERNQPPCIVCPFYAPRSKKESKCRIFENRDDCDKWLGWYNRNSAKRSLASPSELSEVTLTVNNPDFAEELLSTELYQILNTEMPVAIRGDWRRFVEDVNLSKDRKISLFEEIKQILVRHYGPTVEEWATL